MSEPIERQPRVARLIGILQFAATLCSFLNAAAALLLVSSVSATAQESRAQRTWRVEGLVRDTTAGPIPNATVTVYGTTASGTTDNRGRFRLDSIPEGTRVFQVVALGYKPRLVAVGVEDYMLPVTIRLMKIEVILDSMRVFALRHPEDVPHRKRDVIEEKEFRQPEIASGSALDALALLRPQLYMGRNAGGLNPTTEAAQRSQMFVRDVVGAEGNQRTVCLAGRACEVDQRLAVSINGGPVGSPDILAFIPARIVREMRYLLPADAQARFGQTAGGGPVLVVYIR